MTGTTASKLTRSEKFNQRLVVLLSLHLLYQHFETKTFIHLHLGCLADALTSLAQRFLVFAASHKPA